MHNYNTKWKISMFTETHRPYDVHHEMKMHHFGNNNNNNNKNPSSPQ